ncbi:MAG: S41 family peptidase [Peptostreptococcaceae bacterium]|nr:S41 family peptidase [Peptostreptococcaceae bacterium]
MDRKIVKLIAIIIVAAMIITSFSFVIMAPSLFGDNNSTVYGAEIATSEQQLSDQMLYLENYIKFLKENFKDKVDYQLMIDGAFTGATDALGDKYTEYYKTEKDSSNFLENVTGEFSGIGVTLEKDDLGAKIGYVFIGAPAAKAGIQSGDVVVKIEGTSVKGQSIEQISLKLKGLAGTKVLVTVKRGTQEYNFTITREIIKATSVYSKMLENNTGYIQITNFDKDTDSEFEIALREIISNGATSIIIDIRNNGGGLISSAVGVGNKLIRNGVIFHYAKQGQIEETTSAAGVANYTLPTVLLVNENSASASEILAGALKDNKIATLVGTTTYGKGIAQIVTNVGNGHQVKVSSFYFTTPNENIINGKGIVPEYIVDNYAKKGDDVILAYQGFAPMNEQKKPAFGAVGLNVYGAQQRLALLGYDVTVTGTMDASSFAAIKKFQTDNKFFSYGVLDFTTRDRLAQASYNFVFGTGDGDRQLDKAIQLLNTSPI